MKWGKLELGCSVAYSICVVMISYCKTNLAAQFDSYYSINSCTQVGDDEEDNVPLCETTMHTKLTCDGLP